MRVSDSMLDEGGQGLISEVALEVVPGADLDVEAPLFKLKEGAERAEDVVADRAFPAHEKAADVADLLEGMMVAFDLPLQAAHMLEVTKGDLHALFLCGSHCA